MRHAEKVLQEEKNRLVKKLEHKEYENMSQFNDLERRIDDVVFAIDWIDIYYRLGKHFEHR